MEVRKSKIIIQVFRIFLLLMIFTSAFSGKRAYADEENVPTAEDLQPLWVHISEQLQLSLQEDMLREEMSVYPQISDDVLSVKDNQLSVNYTGTARLHMTGKDREGNALHYVQDIVVYADLIHHANDGSGRNSAGGLKLYPSVSADGRSASTDVTTVGDESLFTRSGFILKEWNSEPDGSGVSFAPKDILKTGAYTTDVHLYAIWEKDESQYTIQYDKAADDALGNTPNSVHIHDQAAKLSENGFTREGYVFAGWSFEDEKKENYFSPDVSVVNLSETKEDMLTLKAVWLPDTQIPAEDMQMKRILQFLAGEKTGEEDALHRLRLEALHTTAPLNTMPMPQTDGESQDYSLITEDDLHLLDEIDFHSPGIYTYRIFEDLEDSTNSDETNAYDLIYQVSLHENRLKIIRHIRKDNMQIGDSTINFKELTEEEQTAVSTVLAGQTEQTGTEQAESLSVEEPAVSDSEQISEESGLRSVSDVIKIRALLVGDPVLQEQKYSYSIVPRNTDQEGMEFEDHSEIRILNSGEASFAPIRFSKAGIYTFDIRQTQDQAEGYTFDDTVYSVIYVVSGSLDSLHFTRTIRKNEEIVTEIVFTNRFDLPHYIVNFDTNGSEEEYDELTVKHGNVITSPVPPFRIGYSFAGWKKGEEYYDFTLPVMSSFSLKADWERSIHTVQFFDSPDADEGFKGSLLNSQTVDHGDGAVEPNIPNNRTGYSFLEWTEKFQNIRSDLQIYAQYKPNTYHLDFYANAIDAEGFIQSRMAEYDQEIALPMNTFVRRGHRFVGWSLTSDGEAEFQNREAVKNLGSEQDVHVALYAVWESESDEEDAGNARLFLQGEEAEIFNSPSIVLSSSPNPSPSLESESWETSSEQEVQQTDAEYAQVSRTELAGVLGIQESRETTPLLTPSFDRRNAAPSANESEDVISAERREEAGVIANAIENNTAESQPTQNAMNAQPAKSIPKTADASDALPYLFLIFGMAGLLYGSFLSKS